VTGATDVSARSTRLRVEGRNPCHTLATRPPKFLNRNVGSFLHKHKRAGRFSGQTARA
jgi:hypothetical protein